MTAGIAPDGSHSRPRFDLAVAPRFDPVFPRHAPQTFMEDRPQFSQVIDKPTLSQLARPLLYSD
jgi:hypothetical protein